MPRYNEFRITSYTDKEVKLKPELIDAHKTQVPTDRGHVMISEHEANTNNYYKHSTHLYYELAEEQPKAKSSRDLLKEQAVKLGLEFQQNIKTDKLKELIADELKNN